MRRLSVIAFTGATVASLIFWASPGALAATWSASGTLKFIDAISHASISCSTSTADMVPNTGTKNPVGELTSISFSGCTGPSGAVTLKPTGLSWPISVGTAARTIGQTSGGHGISVSMSSTDCTANLDGTGDKSETGVANFTYTHKSGKLGINITNSNLHLYKPVGCLGLIKNGDAVVFSISYVLK